MKSIKSAAIAAAMTATLAVTSVLPAQAQSVSLSVDQRDRVVREYCDRNGRLDECRDYRRGNWQRGDYDRFYSRHRVGLDQLAFGLFGLTFAGIVGAAIANEVNRNNNAYDDDYDFYDDDDFYDERPRRGNRGDRGDRGRYAQDDWQAHVDRCRAAYRSYDARTDTFQPYGNVPRKRCAL